MRNCLVFLFLMASTTVLFGQQDSAVSVYSFPSVTEQLNVFKTGYYLSEVLDERENKANNGYVNVKGEKKSLVFASDLPSYLQSFIKVTDEQRKILAPIQLHVEKFKIFANTDSTVDKGQIYIKVKFTELDNDFKVHSFERTVSYNEKPSPDFVGKMVYRVFKMAFLGLKNVSRPKVVTTTTSDSTKPMVLVTKSPMSTSSSSSVRTYVIPLPQLGYTWNNPQFRIGDVKDIRTNTANEGNVLEGFFNLKAQAKLDSGLVKYIGLITKTPEDSSKKTLTLSITSFRFQEKLTALGERGTLLFSAELGEDSIGQYKALFQSDIFVDTTADDDITPAWPAVIAETFQRFLTQFDSAHIDSAHSTLLASGFQQGEIRVEKQYFPTRYYYGKKKLKSLKAFKAPFELSPDKAALTQYKKARENIYIGRTIFVFGCTVLAYPLLDYLWSEDKSFRNWYKSDDSPLMVPDKKICLYSGLGLMATGLLFKTAGRAMLDKAIEKHNRGVFKVTSIGFAPDLQNSGWSFQLGMVMGGK
jgi:hypothetical protein